MQRSGGRNSTVPAPRAVRHGTPSGYSHGKCRCTECADAMRTYQAAYRKKNKARVLERDREYNAARSQERNAARRARYAADREGNQRAARDRYNADREGRLATVAEWSRANPTKRQAYRSARKAAKRSAGLFLVTGRDWRRLCARHDNRCAYCGALAPLTQDHVVPIARGGAHSVGNLMPACMSCNASKGPRLLVEWHRDRRNRP